MHFQTVENAVFPSRLVSPLWDCVIITIKVFLVYDEHMIDNAAFPSNLVSRYGVMAPSPLECFCSLLPNGAECSAPLQPVLTAMASYHCHCHHSVSSSFLCALPGSRECSVSLQFGVTTTVSCHHYHHTVFLVCFST